MASYRIRFEGPANRALGVATSLADADGVELVASEPPVDVDHDAVALLVTVEGAFDAVVDALAAIRRGLPAAATLDIVDT